MAAAHKLVWKYKLTGSDEDVWRESESDDLALLKMTRQPVELALVDLWVQGLIWAVTVLIVPGSWAVGDPVNWYYGSGRPGLDPLVPKPVQP